MQKELVKNKIILYLDNLEKDINLSNVIKLIAGLIESAIDKNFDVGGRWDGKGTDFFSGGSQKWKERSKNTLSTYKKSKRGIRPTLIRTGTLKRQIEVIGIGNKIKISANSPYAKIHQYGGDINHPGGTAYLGSYFISNKKASSLISKGREIKRTKPHKIYIPPRPYLTITPDDLKEIKELIKKNIIK